jgi:hypothetical protein
MKLNIGEKLSALWNGFPVGFKVFIIAFGVLALAGVIYQIATGDPGAP